MNIFLKRHIKYVLVNHLIIIYGDWTKIKRYFTSQNTFSDIIPILRCSYALNTTFHTLISADFTSV